MGGWFSKVGSDPYYASYERSLEGLKSSIEKMQDKVEKRQKNLAAVDGTIFMYGLAGFAIAVGVAIWALQQPAGVLSSRQHFMSVLPMFVEPIGAYALYVFWNTLQSVLGRRDKARLTAAEAKLRKMITELKDTTHYQKTLSILSKYDPDFVPPSPLPLAGKMEPRTPGGPLPFRSLRSEMPASALKDTPRRSALGRMTGAGVSNLMPALDKIASSLIGDNPALTQALREAKSEAEALRQRLAASEARAAKLAAQNATMRERLGPAAEDLEPPASPSAAAAQEASGPSTTSLHATANTQQGPAMLSRLSNISTPGFQEGSPAPSSDRRSTSAPATPMASIAGAPADFADSAAEGSPSTAQHQLSGVNEDAEGRDSGDGSFTFVGHADEPVRDVDEPMRDADESPNLADSNESSHQHLS